MFGQPKALASLSSGLLARKGHARPAMRPQGFGAMVYNAGLDDLGWNDMGHEPQSATVSVAEAPAAVPMPMASLVAPVVEAPVPPVLIQREALKEEIEAPAPVAAPAASRPVSLATATRIGRETRHKGKAAFTLRLDQDRHLRLRLASAMDGRSSQQLVTEALDAFLAACPEVEALAVQVPAKKGVR